MDKRIVMDTLERKFGPRGASRTVEFMPRSSWDILNGYSARPLEVEDGVLRDTRVGTMIAADVMLRLK